MCGYLDIMTMLFQYNQDLLSQEVVRYSFIRIRNFINPEGNDGNYALL